MRHSPFDLSIAVMSLVVAASIAGSATRDIFRGPEIPGVEVTSLQLGAGSPTTPSRSIFGSQETVVAWLRARGDHDRAWITVRWVHESGEVIDETTRVVAPQGETAMPFRLLGLASRPPGTYRVEVYVDDQPSAARDFQVLPS